MIIGTFHAMVRKRPCYDLTPHSTKFKENEKGKKRKNAVSTSKSFSIKWKVTVKCESQNCIFNKCAKMLKIIAKFLTYQFDHTRGNRKECNEMKKFHQ